MRKAFLYSVAFFNFSVAFWACNAPEVVPPPTSNKITEVPTQASSSVPPVFPPPQMGQVPNALAGTTWKISEFEITFRDNTRVLVKGGELGKLNPTGVEGKYTLKESVIEISVMGQTRMGTFDDKGLVVEGAMGEKVNK